MPAQVLYVHPLHNFSLLRYDPATLPTTATDGLGADFVAQHTQLPEECLDGQTTIDACWNPDITRAAEAITVGASTDYERVVALQNFFAGEKAKRSVFPKACSTTMIFSMAAKDVMVPMPVKM